MKISVRIFWRSNRFLIGQNRFDRVGFTEYKKWALEGVELLQETKVKECVYWGGLHFDR